jgi:DnaJ-domain-containing protein 1
MRKLTLIIILYCSLLLPVLAEELLTDFSLALRAEQWDTLRNGDALLKQPQLAELMQRWMSRPGSTIELRYPGGEEGEVWVHELIDWLVALGVPSTAMQTLPGSGTDDTIYMVLIHGSN